MVEAQIATHLQNYKKSGADEDRALRAFGGSAATSSPRTSVTSSSTSATG
jgi:hypothetical protein